MGKFSKFDVPKYKPPPVNIPSVPSSRVTTPRGSTGSLYSRVDSFEIPVRGPMYDFASGRADPWNFATPSRKRTAYDRDLEELEMMGGGDGSAEGAMYSQQRGREQAREMFGGEEYGRVGQAEDARLRTERKEAKDARKQALKEAKAERKGYREAAKEIKAEGFIPKARKKVVGFVEGAERVYGKGRAKIEKGLESVSKKVKGGVEKAAEGAKKVTKGQIDPEIDFVKEKLSDQIEGVKQTLSDQVPKKLWQKKTFYAGAALVASVTGAAFQGVQAGKGTNLDGSLQSLAAKLDKFMGAQEIAISDLAAAISALDTWIRTELPKLKTELEGKLGEIESAVAKIIELLGQLAGQAGGSSTQEVGGGGRGT